MRSAASLGTPFADSCCQRPSIWPAVGNSLPWVPCNSAMGIVFKPLGEGVVGGPLVETKGSGTMVGSARLVNAIGASWDITFWRVRPIRHNGGCAYPLSLLQCWANASTPTDSGSGLQLKKVVSCFVNQVVKRSTLNGPIC